MGEPPPKIGPGSAENGEPARPRLTLVGYRFSPQSHQTRDFLARNCVPFEWLDIERDEEARRLVTENEGGTSRLPLIRFPDGSVLAQPSDAQIAEKIGLKTRPGGAFYDLVIVGGGPAGLAEPSMAPAKGSLSSWSSVSRRAARLD